jgi:ribosomal protein S18 acetylase RimI-like enzyme
MQQMLIPGRSSSAGETRAGAPAPQGTFHPMHALDNVIWQALTTRQAEFAEASGKARRFVREVTLLSAFEAPNDEGYAALSRLVGAGGVAAVFLDNEYETRAGWDRIGGAPLVQMVCENGGGSTASNGSAEIVELGARDSPEMVALTALTKPGPFGTRTHELGNYVGIHKEGKLVAMAGERLKVPGYTEVSAVCTHPDYLGRGYAGALMTDVMRRIRERGETPFLHVRADNSRAIALYERLGFGIRHRGYFAVLRRSGGDSF